MAEQEADFGYTRDAIVSAEDMARNKTTKELYKMQAEIAMYMEIAYLSASNFPELSGEIRMSAHGSRTLHMMTVGLMKKYYGASVHIIETMIPLIMDAVELEDGDIILEAYGQIIDLASSMKDEAEETKKRYYDVKTGIQGNIASVRKTEHNEDKKAKANKSAKEKQEQRQQELEEDKHDFEEEKQQRKRKLQKYKERVEGAKASTNAAKRRKKDAEDTLMTDAMMVPLSLTGGFMPAAVMITKCGISAWKYYRSGGEIKEEEQNLQMQKEKKEAEKEKLREVQEALKRTRREEKKVFMKFKELALQETESEFNIASLQEALEVLGTVDKQLCKISEFWEDIVVVISHLKNKTKAGKAFVENIAKPKKAEKFIQNLKAAEKSWLIFKGMCGDYVAVCSKSPEFSVDRLYDFLSKPVDYKPREWKTDRKKLLFQRIEDQLPAITLRE